jgi:uncharacterized RDD family membrane protein YckC
VSAPRIHVETIPVEARSFQGEPAGLITRVAANVIDVAVVILGLVAVYLSIAGVVFLRQGARFTFPIVTHRAAYLAGFVALVVYFTVMWAAAGRTYGDRVLGLRVQTSTGQDVGIVRAGVRAVLCALFPLLLAWVAVNRHSRSVQDLVVGTSVVYDWSATRRPVSSGDPAGVAVDVAAPVANEPQYGDPQPLPRVDGEG